MAACNVIILSLTNRIYRFPFGVNGRINYSAYGPVINQLETSISSASRQLNKFTQFSSKKLESSQN